MEQYKDKLKKRLFFLTSCLILYIVANCVMYVYVGTKGNVNITNFIQGFQFGIGFVVMALFVYHITNYVSALRNEKKLKNIYIEETDERKLMIYQKSGSAGMTFAIGGLAGASVLAGYYDTTIFFTLLGACFFVATIRAVLKLYYQNKY